MSIKEVKLPDLIDMVAEFVNKANRKFELANLMDDLPFGDLTDEHYREYNSLHHELLELQRSIVFYLVGFMGYSLQGAAAPDERIRFVGGNELQKQIEERRNDKSNMDIQTHKS